MPQSRFNISITKIILSTFLSTVLLTGLPGIVRAAVISISPASTKVSAGNIISLRVLVSTAGQAINNAEGIIHFPPDLLNVVSVSKSSSIFSLWIEDPTFSNTDGTVAFNGGAPNPGYTGSGGEVLSVVFMAKKSGVASLVLSDSAVRANDGLGTNVLSGQTGASLSISSNETVPEAVPDKVDIKTDDQNMATECTAGPKLAINSPTNKPDTWVASKNSSFDWSLPDGATAVQTSLSAKDNSTPSVSYVPPIDSKDIQNTPDGVWYFNLRYKTDGCWSDIARYKLKIDAVGPTDLQAKVSAGNDTDNQPKVSLSAKDNLSGVDHYDIFVDDNSDAIHVLAKDLSGGQYVLNGISTGQHNLKVKAFDLAGNASKEVSLSINVLSGSQISPSLEPISNVGVDETFEISGQTGSDAVQTKLFVQRGTETPQPIEVKTDSNQRNAKFVWSGKLALPGNYQAWVETVNSDGVKETSPELSFKVSSGDVLKSLGIVWSMPSPETFEIIGAVCLLLLLAFVLYKFHPKRKKTKGTRPQIDISNVKAFSLMESNVAGYIKTLEKVKKKRSLTDEEKIILQGLKKQAVALDKFFDEQRRLAERD